MMNSSICLKNPLVSIILPCYNRSHLLGRAIGSLISQTYENFEIIVVDDASTDSTAKVVSSFNDQRIRYLKNHLRKGAAYSRNVGIRNALGYFIGFQDSDDEWLPDKLAKQMAVFAMASEDTGVVFTGFMKEKSGVRTYVPPKHIRIDTGDLHRRLLWGNFVGTPALLVKIECFYKAGYFDESLPRYQDWELTLRFSSYYGFKFIDEPLFIAYYEDDNISNDSVASLRALNMIFNEFKDEITADKILLAHYQHLLGLSSAEIGNRKEAVRYILNAVTINPCSFKYFVSLLIGILSIAALNRLVAFYSELKK
jgi:glycosyltransferase involved in cell wall biosynthesis